MLTKIIVSVQRNLAIKYGRHLPMLHHELSRLTSDARFTTKLIYLDDAAMMSAYGKGAITVPVSERDCKDWIDAVYLKENPDYLILFGSQDIVPFQSLDNPLFGRRDKDLKIPSDLPYASDSPYDTNIATFTNPTRVVGRIPDIPGTADVIHVRSQIDFILNYVPRPLSQYMNYIGLSTQVWSLSTGQSLRNLFGNSAHQKDFPPNLNPVPAFSPLTHFINCHGALRDPGFYGEGPVGPPPLALHSFNVTGIQSGTIVSAECCYGAQVFIPIRGTKSIASAYMENHAAGFMGSSNIAYGPPYGNDLADIICQDFLVSIFKGASTGRALLEARQKYIFLKSPHLSPYDAKTIAQFYLLGDPSVQPVLEVADADSSASNRRSNMKAKGFWLGETTLIAQKVEKAPRPENLDTRINALLERNGIDDSDEEVFEIPFPPLEVLTLNSFIKAYPKPPSSPIRFRIFETKDEASKGDPGIYTFRVLMIKEDGRNILEARVYAAR